MFEHKRIQRLEDYFLPKSRRPENGTYFYRISGCSDEVERFIEKYFQDALRSGVVIEGRIPNPDERNLAYYEEIMGKEMQLDRGFFASALKKWLPRMTDLQRNDVASAVFDVLETMKRQGKNENMLRNAYIKYMCWLYYRFERVVNRLGGDRLPKILYEGQVTVHELNFLSVLSKAGCDIVLLQYGGDGGYLKIDPSSSLSLPLQLPGLSGFPEGFCLKALRQRKETRQKNVSLYGNDLGRKARTNVWIEGRGLEDILKPADQRGEAGGSGNFFYNCFLRICGVWDKSTYQNDLYRFEAALRQEGRRVLIVEGGIPRPSVEEIEAVKRSRYADAEQMAADLSRNIISAESQELQRLMRSAFAAAVLEESAQEDMNLNRLTNRAVYMLCWLKRYQGDLFKGWKRGDIGCFICLGGCRDGHEAAFLKYLAMLPTDVLILTPDPERRRCCLEDSLLYEIRCEDSLPMEQFPRAAADVRVATAAYQAERELDTVLYQDSGMYRDQQYKKAVAVTLKPIYEEIAIMWDEELKYRPNFGTSGDTVEMPVIFSKVSGVKDGQVSQYWADVRKLVTENCFLIRQAPFLRREDPNPVRAHVSEFFKNGKLQRAKLKAHSCYRYAFLREEVQEYMLDKLQLLIDGKLIAGTFENGTEYAIVAAVLNLPKDILRLIQGFDFTKKNPKLIYINTTETIISLEDSILAAYLNLVGFDIVFFVPTGYRCVEKYFNKKVMEEHLIGEFVYDLTAPDFGAGSSGGRSWVERLFGRGR